MHVRLLAAVLLLTSFDATARAQSTTQDPGKDCSFTYDYTPGVYIFRCTGRTFVRALAIAREHIALPIIATYEVPPLSDHDGRVIEPASVAVFTRETAMK